MLQPSCPALVVHADDAFRKSLIATLDQTHFTVSFAADGDGAIDLLKSRSFNVVLLGINLGTGTGLRALKWLEGTQHDLHCGVVILGESDPAIRTLAPWADETLIKPVDPAYVATRARAYCGCP